MNNIFLRYGLAFAAALLLQITFVPLIEIVTWKPNLVLVVLTLLAIHHGKIAGSTAGFVVGLASDLLSGGLLGLSSMSKSISGYIAGGVAGFFQERSQFIFTLLIAGACHDLIWYFVSTLGEAVNWWVILRFHIIPNLLYTAIVGMLIFIIFKQFVEIDE